MIIAISSCGTCEAFIPINPVCCRNCYELRRIAFFARGIFYTHTRMSLYKTQSIIMASCCRDVRRHGEIDDQVF